MKYFLRGYILMMAVLVPLLLYVHSLDTQKTYTPVSQYSLAMFSGLSVILYFFLRKSVKSPNKQLFISITLTNMLVKMVFSIVLLLIYRNIYHPADGKFIIPFLFVYIFFTTFETWFMIKMADEKPN